MELKLEHLTKCYGKKTALDQLSYTFSEGIYGILGANGAGKSTMMGLLTDNLSRTGGRIQYNGTDILQLGKEYRSLVGFMPQEQGFYEDFSAFRFLCYIGALKGIPGKKRR